MTLQQPVMRPGTKRTGIILVVLGLLVGVACIAGIVSVVAREVVPDVTTRNYTTPVDTNITLDKATYVIWQEDGSATAALSPSQVEITDPNGTSVPVGTAASNQTQDRNGVHFVAALSFVAPQHGSYHVSITSESSTTVFVGHDLAQVGLHIVGWFFGGVLAAIALIAGIIVLIVRNSRNKNDVQTAFQGGQAWQAGQPWQPAPVPWTTQPPPGYYGGQQAPQVPVPPQPAQLPAPGWYADPAEPGSGKLRWWDGQNWAP